MTSPAKAAANAANSLLSTGPRTEEGKARSSRNATTHGLFTREFVIREGEREEFEQFEAEHHAALAPVGLVERSLYEQLVHAAWNMKRVRRLEAELAANGTDPLSDPDLGPTLDRLARYHSRFERSYYRALKALQSLQTNRLAREAFGSEEAQCLPELADAAELTKRSQTLARTSIKDHLASIDLETAALMNDYREKRRTESALRSGLAA